MPFLYFKMVIVGLKGTVSVISSDLAFIEWHVRCTFETFISPSFLKQLKCNNSHCCRDTANENNQFSKLSDKALKGIVLN